MTKIISVHEYVLKPEIDPVEFERAIQEAKKQGILELAGLESVIFVQGIRGERQNLYAAFWVYENEEDWASLWGPVEHPISKDSYPQAWRVWEDDILAPFLDQEPDKITFTTYREI